MATQMRRNAAWEYRQQLRRQGMSPGEADQAALRRFPDVTLDELNPGHGRSTLDKIGSGLKKAFNAISPIDIGGPDLPSTVPPRGSVPFGGDAAQERTMPTRFDLTRSAQPGGFGSGPPFDPMGGFPGFMPATGMAPPGFGVSPLTVAAAPGMADPTNPAGIGGQATPGPATAGGGGMSTLEKMALISQILGGVANIGGAIFQGSLADREQKRAERREREQRIAREALLPAYLELLRSE